MQRRDKLINGILPWVIILLTVCIVPLLLMFNTKIGPGHFCILFWVFLDIYLIVFWFKRRNMTSRALNRINKGQASQVRLEYEAWQAKGDQSPLTSYILSRACFEEGDWFTAQAYAETTLNRLSERGDFFRDDDKTAWLCVNAALNIHNIFNVQGRYLEAARVLQAFPRFDELHPSLHVQIAWSYYLGTDITNAMLRLKSISEKDVASAAPGIIIQYAYLRYKLCGDDPRPVFQQYKAALPNLDPRVRDTPNSLYAQYLRQITDEIRALMENDVDSRTSRV